MTHAGRNLLCTVVAACAVSVAPVAAPPALAWPSEVFRGPDGVTGLLYRPETSAPPGQRCWS
jgi:hypothetical protein